MAVLLAMEVTNAQQPQPGSDWIVSGGEMGHLIRTLDWSQSPLGPIASWSQSLRTTVNLCLASDLPICIIWGPELVQLYNDGYRVICGEKHPHSMGQNFSECWREAWPVIGAAHDSALAGDTAFLEDQQIFLERHGYVEETFFTFSFSPIRDETGSLVGLFHPVIETTAKMQGERRTRSLRDLASGTSNATTIDEAFAGAARSLSEYTHDLPFLLAYRLSETENQAHLVAATGLASAAHGAPQTVKLLMADDASWPLSKAAHAGKPILVDDVVARFGTLNPSPYAESVAAAVLLPIVLPGAEQPTGIVIAGVSPRLKPNEMYLGFLGLLSGAITTAVANADAYDAERKRAEALARIDKAKTEFFSNVSHEFRTPLTLMLGPLEDALAGAGLPSHERGLIDVAHRNSVRLLKLVNSLLDFSRFEAGRVQARYEPVALADTTAMLASNFRSICERAGLALVVDCPPLPEPVYVDRDMWEKIVLNLLSNAFKFTFEGEVAIGVRAEGDRAILTVRDTGVGIPSAELPRMFERFHRVENQKGRSFEGSGIGLSLVRELVGLHSGAIRVESEVGRGTLFAVSIPFGTNHLLADQLRSEDAAASTAVRASAFVEEAARWLPDDTAIAASTAPLREDLPEGRPASPQAGRSRVLLADDNADMRDYIQRLLEPHHDIEAVADGKAALEAAMLRRPDLVITDVMMPKLDGLGLVRAIRNDTELRDLPIIMLSARAGEEASAEGLTTGADDYLVKPFSARDLLVRVNSSLAMARLRRESSDALRKSEEQLRQLNIDLERQVIERTQARGKTWAVTPDLMGALNAKGYFETSNPAWQTMLGWTEEEVRRTSVWELLHPDDLDPTRDSFALTQDGQSAIQFPNRYRCKDGSYRWISWVGVPDDGMVYCTGRDITLEKAQADALAVRTAERDQMWHISPDLLLLINFEGVFHRVNPAWTTILGYEEHELVGMRFDQLIHPDDRELTEKALSEAKNGTMPVTENRYRHKDGSYRWLSWITAPPESGMVYVTGRHITAEKERQADLGAAQEALRQSQKMEAMGQLTGGVAHDFNNLLTPVMMGLEMLRRSHDDARSQKLISGALQSAERAKTLIQRLLTFSRRQALEPRPVDVATLLANLRDLIDRSLGPMVEVLVNVEDNLPAAVIDPNQLELAILNLSVNARDAMPDGGTLTIAVTSERLPNGKDRALAPGQYVRISISDNGCGMDPETLARSIEPFFSTKEIGQGTGLGLAMVHGLAAQSGGMLRMDSEPGVGTEASLWVPTTTQLAEVVALPLLNAPTAQRFATLLLVDDEELVRSATAEGLRTLGYAVVEAASAAKALDHVAGGLRPDLVVTDHMMPGMTGAQLAAELRRIAPSLPVLMITGYANMTPGQTQGLEVLVKPFGHIELAARVESLLQSSTATPSVSASPSL